MAKKKKNKTSRKMNIQELPTDARDSIFKQMDALSTGRFALTNRKNRDDTRDSIPTYSMYTSNVTSYVCITCSCTHNMPCTSNANDVRDHANKR